MCPYSKEDMVVDYPKPDGSDDKKPEPKKEVKPRTNKFYYTTSRLKKYYGFSTDYPI